ncbi:MAG: hypothetical protein ACI8P3_002133 [Saprospiraceae bacterium]|jgi:hypothetical protein
MWKSITVIAWQSQEWLQLFELQASHRFTCDRPAVL